VSEASDGEKSQQVTGSGVSSVPLNVTDRRQPDIVITNADGTITIFEVKQFTQENLSKLAEQSPEATVLSGWFSVEDTIRRIAPLLKVDVNEENFEWLAFTTLDALHMRGALSNPESIWSVVQRMSRMRNTVANGRQITKLEAYDYAAAALRITEFLIDAYNRVKNEG
jgi:hypothetical protein